MAKILIVEDDNELVMLLREWLGAQNYTIDVTSDGRDGLEFIRRGGYDLIILDWNLPGCDGVEICRSYRNNGGVTPILMITAKDKIDDKEEGFDAGADDYLTKPFSMRELSARLRALLKRPPAVVSPVLTMHGIELHAGKYIVRKNNAEVKLMRRDFELLEFFMRHPGQFFSVDSLLDRIWSLDSEATSDAVRSAVKRIRKSLDDESADESSSIIENVRRIGYRLRSED